MRHLSLFNGIGGFQLAAHWMGWSNVAHVENDPFCNRIVNYHFPESKQYEDIKEFAATEAIKYRGHIDIITGGFPCQPFSNAGRRKGKGDDRHLWPEMLETIRRIRPRYVVGENVRGIVSWNEGMVFEEVCSGLEDEGFEVLPVVLPAAGIGAPHRRERCWFIAHSYQRYARRETRGYAEESKKEGVQERNEVQQLGESGEVQWSSGNSKKPDQQRIRSCEKRKEGETGRSGCSYCWKEFPTEPPLCGGDDGLPSELDDITLPKWRRESIKAYGNAIVPQVALNIFRTIQNTDNETSH